MSFLIIILFAMIHYLEFSSFYCRVSGIYTNSVVTSYSLQQSFFVLTRFFFIFLMPALGFLIDSKISLNHYMTVVILSLFGASISYIISFKMRKKIINFFMKVIIFYKKKRYISSIYLAIKSSKVIYFDNTNKIVFNKMLVFASSIVFCCYSIAVFISFYLALYFYDYRTSISQTSGIINALATLILTFYIEPHLSRKIDLKSADALDDIFSIMLGRFLGVFLISPIIIFFIWL